MDRQIRRLGGAMLVLFLIATVWWIIAAPIWLAKKARLPDPIVAAIREHHGTKLIRFRDDKDADQCTWREVRPARSKDDPTFESLLSLASA